jgi:hypothetical protein
MWHLHLLRHITRGRREASSSASLRFYKRRIRRPGQVIIRPGLHVSPGTSHAWEMRVNEIQPQKKIKKLIGHWNNSEWISVVLFYPQYFIIIRLEKFSVFAFQMTGVPYTIRLFFHRAYISNSGFCWESSYLQSGWKCAVTCYRPLNRRAVTGGICIL